MIKRPQAFLCCSLLGCCATFASPALGAPLLLTINDSNPAAVTFTATGTAPGVTDASHVFAQGIGLAGFFGTNPSAGFFPSIMATSTSLTTGVDGTPDYTSAQSASFSGSLTDDLEVSGTSGAAPSGNTQNFNTGFPAFTGNATFDFAASTFYTPGDLPAAGTTGGVFSGAGGLFQASPVLLGSFQVVTPEPSGVSLILLGVAALAFGRFRKTAAKAQ